MSILKKRLRVLEELVKKRIRVKEASILLGIRALVKKVVYEAE